MDTESITQKRTTLSELTVKLNAGVVFACLVALFFSASTLLLSAPVFAKANSSGWCSSYHKKYPNRNNDESANSVIPDKWTQAVCEGWYMGGYNGDTRQPATLASKDAKAAGVAQKKADKKAASAPASTNSGSSGGSGSGTSTSSPSTASSASPASSMADSETTPADSTTVVTVKDPALDCTQDGANEGDCDLIAKYLNPIITFFSAFVGIAVVIGIISGGIMYSTAGDDPQKTARGRNQVRNAIIALVAYIFLYAMIKWLIPQAS